MGMKDYNQSPFRVVSFGMNPSVNDPNEEVRGKQASHLLDELFSTWMDAGEINTVAVTEVNKIMDNYHELPKPHAYFRPLSDVLRLIETSYKIVPKYNTAIHVDIFKWSTVKSWGRLPKDMQSELLSLACYTRS